VNHGGAPLDRESTGVLLRRARAGSLGALDELFARLRRSVRRWSANWLRGKTGHRGESTDIVELVVSRALPRIQGYDPRHRDALRQYLRGAVRERAGEDLRFFEGLRESATADGDAPVAEQGDTPAAVQ
jgi:DNA-directed RNA polymerase specialized sigma24 family protein